MMDHPERADQRNGNRPMRETSHATSARPRLRRALLGIAAAVAAAVVAPLSAAPAAAAGLTIVGPDAITATGGCMPLTWYDIQGGTGNKWFNRVSSIAGNLYFGRGADGATGAFLTGKPVDTQTVVIGATDDAGDVVTKTVELTVPPGDMRPGDNPPLTGMMCPGGQRYYFAHQGEGFYYTVIQHVGGSGSDGAFKQFVYDDNDGFYIKCYSSCDWMQTAMRVRRDTYDYPVVYELIQPEGDKYLMKGPNDGHTLRPDTPWDGITAGEPEYPFPDPYATMRSAKGDPGVVWPLGVDYGVGGNAGFDDVTTVIKMYQSHRYGLCTNGQNGVFYPGYYNCVDFSNQNCSTRSAAPWCPGRGLLDWGADGRYAGTFTIRDAWTPTVSDGNDDQVYTRFAAGPDEGTMEEIVSLFKSKGIAIENFPAVYHRVADNSRQLVKALDGRRSYMCDAVAWTSSRIIAEAPYLLNAVFCGGDISYGRYPAPRLALDPGVPPTPRGALDVDPDAESGASCTAANPKG